MAISDELLEFWIDRVSELEGISMDADKLVEDIVLIAIAFDQDSEILSAVMTNTIEAFKLIVRDRSIGQELMGNKSVWSSYHFQSRRIRKQKADMRLVYRDSGTSIQIMGFGHRWLPQQIYDRLSLGRP